MINIMNGDTIEKMKTIKDNSIDLILTDLPFGTTKNKWDVIIPFEDLWNEYERIIKDHGAIILFAQELFAAKLIVSNEKLFRYTIVWNKKLTTGHLNANKMPLRSHELLCVFYKHLPTYNPQKIKGKPNHGIGSAIGKKPDNNHNYGTYTIIDSNKDGMKFPKSIWDFEKVHPSKTVHPTQKPINLLEYIILTYSNPGDIVLDNTMGSGSTGIAAQNTNRSFIGIELDKSYFEIAKKRLEDNKKEA